MAEIIDGLHSYTAKKSISSITKYKECLDKFYVTFLKEAELTTETPIFLDASVLLRYYSISFTAREKLYEFIDKKRDKIILTSNVQFEYLKNREDLIQRFFAEVIPKIEKDFDSEIIYKMTAFVNNHKVVLKDYSFVESGILSSLRGIKELQDKLIDAVEKRQGQSENLIFEDKLLELLSRCKLLDSLTDNENVLVKKEYDLLVKNVKPEGINSLLNKPNAVFPGLGDFVRKPENPYGDYIIFHEIMKYMIESKSNAIFLTFDNSKGDWIKADGNPHLHYVQNMYANTEHLLYIVDADRTLGELLDVSVKSLLVTQENGTSATKSQMLMFVDFVSVRWILNHWGSKVCFREGRNILFKGNALQSGLTTDGCHCNLVGVLVKGRLHKIECKARARGENPTGKLSLWCHDDVGDPNVSKGVSDETGYIKIAPEGTVLTLYFVASNNSNVRIHIQYMPGPAETGEIIVENGVSISLVD